MSLCAQATSARNQPRPQFLFPSAELGPAAHSLDQHCAPWTRARRPERLGFPIATGAAGIWQFRRMRPSAPSIPRPRWDLSRSRAYFLGKHGMPRRDRSFWWWAARRFDFSRTRAEIEADPSLRWTPDRSNCPELDVVATGIVDSLPNEWHSVASGVFVGRTMAADVNAEAKQLRGKAYISLSLQLTIVLPPVATALDRFRAVFEAWLTDSSLPESNLDGVFDHIEAHAEGWQSKVMVGSHPLASLGPNRRGAAFYSDVSGHAEAWAVSHEYAHHLLGHTSRSARRADVHQFVRDVAQDSRLEQFVFERSMPASRELQCDILGLILQAGDVDGRASGEDWVSALIGAVVCLVAEAQINRHWFLSVEDYPSTADRVGAVLAVGHQRMSSLAPTVADDLAGQLAAFATAALQSSLHRLQPLAFPAPTWSQVWTSAISKRIAVVSTRGMAPRRGWISLEEER